MTLLSRTNRSITEIVEADVPSPDLHASISEDGQVVTNNLKSLKLGTTIDVQIFRKRFVMCAQRVQAVRLTY